MNIVFSTTRQWNPGDEFILMGCIRSLKLAGLDFNPVIFNRNPQIRRTGKAARLHRIDDALFGGRIAPFLDNSVKDNDPLDFADLVVFAGSPEWRGKRLAPLYRRIIEQDLPTIFLGLGTNRPFSFTSAHFSKEEMAVFQKARLITCRDTLTTNSLHPLPVHHLTCPALVSCPEETLKHEVKRIGLIYGSDRAVRHNNISPATHDYLSRLYKHLIQRLGDRFEFEFIAHYIDELRYFPDDFPQATLRYSYDARDYADIYARYDLVIGHRVHGIGISASQGTPGICISHDMRGETARGFGADMIQVGTPPEDVLHRVLEAVDGIESRSRGIIEHKREVTQTYTELLAGAIGHDR